MCSEQCGWIGVGLTLAGSDLVKHSGGRAGVQWPGGCVTALQGCWGPGRDTGDLRRAKVKSGKIRVVGIRFTEPWKL